MLYTKIKDSIKQRSIIPKVMILLILLISVSLISPIQITIADDLTEKVRKLAPSPDELTEKLGIRIAWSKFGFESAGTFEGARLFDASYYCVTNKNIGISIHFIVVSNPKEFYINHLSSKFYPPLSSFQKNKRNEVIFYERINPKTKWTMKSAEVLFFGKEIIVNVYFLNSTQLRLSEKVAEIVWSHYKNVFLVEKKPEEKKFSVEFTITPDIPTVNNEIVFTAVVSGSVSEYRWYLDGKYVTGGAKVWQWKWLKPTVGEHVVKLVVKDKDGNTASYMKKFEVIQTGVLARSKYLGAVVDKDTIIPIEVVVNGSVDVILTDGKLQHKYHLEKGMTTINYRLDPNALGLSEEQLLKKDNLRIWVRALYPSGTEEYYLDFKLYRKPVLLIHGLWSSATTWKKMVIWLKGAGFKVYILDYKKANAADPRYIARTYLVNMMKKIKNDYEESEIAINSIDIVAHSMGGIVSRFYIQCINNKFKALNVSRLITIGTPHLGSPEPQHYHDWIHGKGARKIVAPIINFIQKHESEGSLGKDGPALRELKPNSDTLKMINSRPLNVKLYAIVGINNWLGWYGVSCTKNGDSIVEIESQKYRADKVYYVWEWHLSETGSYQVFEIVKDILKEKPVPSIYKSYTSVAYSIKVISVYSSNNALALGFHKQWEVSGFKPEEGVKIEDGMEITEGVLRDSTGKKLGSYNVISMGSKLGSNPKNGDNAYVVLEVRNLVKELIGKVAIRVKYPSGGLYAPRLLILSPSTFYVFPGSEIYVKHKGPLNIITDTSCIKSHDPEVVIKVFENKSVEIISLEGKLDVWGSGKSSTTISKDQKVIVSTNGQLSKPTNIDTTKIERWWPTEKRGIIDIILGILQIFINFIKGIISQIAKLFFSK